MTDQPLALGRVALTVHDLDRVGDFYQRAAGLHRLRADGESLELGVDGTVLLELRRDPGARRRSPRDAGLFHTAFLLPSRADLGAWARHASATRTPVVGASDHIVSEAIYLSDPEGNGVEIYADRPASSWTWRDGLVEMATEQLDVPDLLDHTGSRTWQGFPAGSTVGHVHLQVGALPPAEAFYAAGLGFDITARYPGGTFYAMDGYHHHLATNIWNSRGAVKQDAPSTGLADVEILLGPARLAAAEQRLAAARSGPETQGHLTLHDPWGIAITLIAR